MNTKRYAILFANDNDVKEDKIMNEKNKNKIYLLTLMMGVMGLFHLYLSTPGGFHYLEGTGAVPFVGDVGRLRVIRLLYFSFTAVNFLFIRDLLKRKRISWYVELGVTVAALGAHLLHFRRGDLPYMIYYIIALVLFYITRKEFTLKTKGTTPRGVFRFLAIILLVVFTQSFLTVLIINSRNHLHLGLPDMLGKSAWIVVGGSVDFGEAFNHTFIHRYQETLWIQTLLILAIAVMRMLAPIFEKTQNKGNLDLESFVVKYGQNPLAYLTMEEDKEIFYGNKVEGVCGYRIVNGVFVVCGDIICRREDAEAYLQEIQEFCEKNGLDLLFVNGTDYFSEEYERIGMRKMKYGEDACFLLSEYNLAGKKAAKVRAAINHAKKADIITREYKPLEKREPMVEEAMNAITEEWLRNKGGIMMDFAVGSLSLENPGSRRYFYALEGEEIIGFVVWDPYDDKRGYLADITRRKEGSAQGAIEKTVYDSLMIMKEEGVLWGNMGLSPLYNVAAEERDWETGILTGVYEKFDKFYDFKALHHSKEKYGPTHWESRYLYFTGKANPAKIMTALIRAHFPERIWDGIVKHRIGKIKE